jgi:hypothetical protein
MNKEFVSYEQALALKELGFDEPCMASRDMNNDEGLIQIPLYQQAFRWFREKYKLDSSIALVANGYGFYVHKDRNYTNNGESYGFYIKYEEAEQACLDKLIEICKNK